MNILSNRDFTNGKAFLDTGYKFGQVRTSSKGIARKTMVSSEELIRVKSVGQSVTPHKNNKSPIQKDSQISFRSNTDLGYPKRDQIKSSFSRGKFEAADQNQDFLHRATYKDGEKIKDEHVSIPISMSKLNEYKKFSSKRISL